MLTHRGLLPPIKLKQLDKDYLLNRCVDFVFFGGHFEFFGQMVRDLEPRNIGSLGQSESSRKIRDSYPSNMK